MLHRSVLLHAALVLLTTTASGAPILTYDFTGRVTSISDNAAFDLNGTIPLNTSVSGRVVYDAGASGTTFPNGGGTTAVYNGATLSFSVNVGNGLLVWDSGPLDFFLPRVVVADNFSSGSLLYDLISIEGGSLTPTSLVLPAGTTTSTPFALVGSLQFIDFGALAVSNTSMPTTFDLSAFDNSTFSLNGGRPGGTTSLGFPGFIGVRLDSLTLYVPPPPPPPSVPEPASLTLLGMGTIGVGAISRRRRRHQIQPGRNAPDGASAAPGT
jgi:hypothetical protein